MVRGLKVAEGRERSAGGLLKYLLELFVRDGVVGLLEKEGRNTRWSTRICSRQKISCVDHVHTVGRLVRGRT